MILSFPFPSHQAQHHPDEDWIPVAWLTGLAEKICDVWLPVVPNLPRIPIPLMNTFFPFFPALISLRSALIVIINALLGIECADRYKLPPALFWRLQAHSWDNTSAVLAAGLGNKPFKN